MTHGSNTLMLMGVPVIQANALLDASYRLYRRVESHKTIVRTVIYALPATLHRQVRTVVLMTASGGSAGGLMKSASGQPATMLSSRVDINEIKLEFLRWLCNTYAYTPTTMTGLNVVVITGSLGDIRAGRTCTTSWVNIVPMRWVRPLPSNRSTPVRSTTRASHK